mmetsp:Transcript_71830/g.158635  ORF Transcript_71830/g.158635 Transcript_71830/m.158635 type:complete len:106 (-) Transcript_71830:76-393(-)
MATAFCLTFGAFLRDWQRFALQELSGDMTGLADEPPCAYESEQWEWPHCLGQWFLLSLQQRVDGHSLWILSNHEEPKRWWGCGPLKHGAQELQLEVLPPTTSIFW